ncbi:MAG: flagella synthesis protein FlgN [Gammaproteobacteria bacterium]|jgi:flagellar biosynthesis/type III secretory pathway chaperone
MNDHQGRLQSLLKQESSVLEDLYTVLQKELLALKERNFESISSLAEEKNMLLVNLEKLDRDRQQYSQETETSVTNEIAQLQSEIKVYLDKCQKQNSINGGIIEVSKLFNEKMLDIISGNDTKEATYGATGKNNSNKNQHSLGRV